MAVELKECRKAFMPIEDEEGNVKFIPYGWKAVFSDGTEAVLNWQYETVSVKWGGGIPLTYKSGTVITDPQGRVAVNEPQKISGLSLPQFCQSYGRKFVEQCLTAWAMAQAQ